MMIVIGAGKIGRGFLTHLIRASGKEAVLIDKDLDLVDTLNEYPRYPLRVVAPEGIRDEWIDGYIALHTGQTEAIRQAVERAELMLVSVGAGNLDGVAEYLAPALLARPEDRLLNIVACENMVGAHLRLKEAVHRLLGGESRRIGHIAFASACVGKTAPLPPAALLKKHPLSLVVDGYGELPIDESTVLQPFPALSGATLYPDFDYCIRRKLYIHNMGHATAAYLGALRGYADLARAMEDPWLRQFTQAAMREAAQGLTAAYPYAEGLEEYIQGLLALFANADMGDTLARIGADPLRKTSAEDRLAGALRFCHRQGVDAPHIAGGLAAALHFAQPGDPSSKDMRQRLHDEGVPAFLQSHSGLPDNLAFAVQCAYVALGEQKQ